MTAAPSIAPPTSARRSPSAASTRSPFGPRQRRRDIPPASGARSSNGSNWAQSCARASAPARSCFGNRSRNPMRKTPRRSVSSRAATAFSTSPKWTATNPKPFQRFPSLSGWPMLPQRLLHGASSPGLGQGTRRRQALVQGEAPVARTAHGSQGRHRPLSAGHRRRGRAADGADIASIIGHSGEASRAQRAAVSDRMR